MSEHIMHRAPYDPESPHKYLVPGTQVVVPHALANGTVRRVVGEVVNLKDEEIQVRFLGPLRNKPEWYGISEVELYEPDAG